MDRGGFAALHLVELEVLPGMKHGGSSGGPTRYLDCSTEASRTEDEDESGPAATIVRVSRQFY